MTAGAIAATPEFFTVNYNEKETVTKPLDSTLRPTDWQCRILLLKHFADGTEMENTDPGENHRASSCHDCLTLAQHLCAG